MTTCPYVCNNKTKFGYCCSTVCINPMYNQQSITQWLEKADYVQVVRCKDCKHFKRDMPCVGVYGERKTNACEWHGFSDVKPDWYCANGERKDESP